MARRNGKLRRVAECIYERNGVYVVTMSDGQGGKFWDGGLLTLEDAKDVRAKQRHRKRQLGGKAKKGPETIESFGQRWTRDFPRPEESTDLNNRQMVRRFVKEYGHLRLSKFTGEMAREFALAYPSDAVRVRVMFADAKRDGADGLQQNPFDGITIPRSDGRRDITVLTAQELSLLKAVAVEVHGPEYGPRYAAFIELAAWTGMRPGELFALSWHDIDVEHVSLDERGELVPDPVIRVNWARQEKTGMITLPKGRKRREIALIPPAERALRELERLDAPRPVVVRKDPRDPRDPGHEAPLVFSTKRKRPYHHRNHIHLWTPVREALYEALPDHRKQAVGPHMDFYELRHYFGSYLADHRVMAHEIADQMGHADNGALAMKVYVHSDKRALRARLRSIFDERDERGKEAVG